MILLRTCFLLSGDVLASLLTAVIYGVATMAWPYAVRTQTEPLVALCTLSAFYFVIQYERTGRQSECIYAGLCSALAILTRPETVLQQIPIGLYLVGSICRRHGISQSTLRRCVVYALAVSVGAIGVLMWNYWRFGSPTQSGYPHTFSTPLLVGLYGQLFSSGKGVFFYNPILVVAMFGWSRFHRARPLEACTAGAVIGTGLLTYSKYWAWGGDISWGPRFLVVILPVAMIPLSYVRWWPRGKLVRIAVLSTIAVSIWIQILGVFVSSDEDYAYKANRRFADIEEALMIGEDNDVLVHYVPSFSPLAGHVGRWQGWRTSLRWFPYHQQERHVTVIGLAFLLLLVVSGWRVLAELRYVGSSPAFTDLDRRAEGQRDQKA
jgi:hypothetical protein